MSTLPININRMKKNSAKIAQLLRLLGNEDRLIILVQLLTGEFCVSELEEVLDIHQPTLSQQLSVLRGANFVSTRREGKNIYYSVENQFLIAVIRSIFNTGLI